MSILGEQVVFGPDGELVLTDEKRQTRALQALREELCRAAIRFDAFNDRARGVMVIDAQEQGPGGSFKHHYLSVGEGVRPLSEEVIKDCGLLAMAHDELNRHILVA